MKFSWHIHKSDVLKVQGLVDTYGNSPLIRDRKARYRSRGSKRVAKATFWRASILGLVTSQQPSSPGTPVWRFLERKTFPLTFRRCSRQKDLRAYAEDEFRAAHLRFWERLGGMVATNFDRMSVGLWDETSEVLEKLRKARSRGKDRAKKVERAAAGFIDRSYMGFGPKQSRNLLQYLGLTKYEIPLDSRVMKWLNDFGFPIRLSAQGLADQHYYTFVMDAVQELCEKSGVEPYILDAVIFTSYNKPVRSKS